MAQYNFDISEQTNGSNPLATDDWVQRNSTSGSDAWSVSVIEAETTPVGTKHWKMVTDRSTWSFNQWLVPDDADDIEVLMLTRRNNTSVGMGPLVRLNSGTGNIAGYFLGFRNNATEIRSRIWATASRNDNAAVAHGITTTTDVWFWIRVSAVGTALKLRVWEYGGDEPTGWGLEFTDSTYTNGGVGFGDNIISADREFLLAWYSVGTEGDPAPHPGDDDGLAFTVEPAITTRTTTSYTLTGTTNADCDVYAVATLTTAADPDGPQIFAGTDGDDTAAEAAADVAATGGTPFTLTLSDLTESAHNIHVVPRRDTVE